MAYILDEVLLLSLIVLLAIYDVQCAPPPPPTTRYAETNPINIVNLQKLASLSPGALHQTFRYLENPYIATALVENDRNSKERLVAADASPPFQFDEPLENSDLQNHILRGKGAGVGGNNRSPINFEEVLKDPILGPYFDGGIEEDSRNVKLNIRT